MNLFLEKNSKYITSQALTHSGCSCDVKVYDGIFVLYLFGAEPNFYPSNDNVHRFTQVLRKLNTPQHSTIARTQVMPSPL